jgi:hypothetical protein
MKNNLIQKKKYWSAGHEQIQGWKTYKTLDYLRHLMENEHVII